MKRPPRFWARHVDVVADRHGQEILTRYDRATIGSPDFSLA